jgi:DNA replication and repair protein RecF
VLDGRSAGAFGSQGQLRSLVLSFKLAQLQDCFERGGSYPVLLLDDVGSELDAERSEYLFEFISKIGAQTFITTTRPGLLPLGNNVLVFEVVNGTFQDCSGP